MVDQICTYLFQKRGIFYYSRRVPKELQPKVGRQRIIVSLKTKSPTKANSLGQLVTQKLDEEWLLLRLGRQFGLASGSTQNVAPFSFSNTSALPKAAWQRQSEKLPSNGPSQHQAGHQYVWRQTT
jgi:hypothetical protein